MRRIASAAGAAILAALVLPGCSGKLAKENEGLKSLVQQLRDRSLELEKEMEGLRSEKPAVTSVGDLPTAGKEAGVEWMMDKDGLTHVILPEKFFFSSGKASLTSKGQQAIQEVAKVIGDKYGDHQVLVVGHTDSDPIKKSLWSSNLHLSAARASTVGEELLKAGIPEKKLMAAGRGPADPVKANDTKEHKAANRRVELVLLPAELAQLIQ